VHVAAGVLVVDGPAVDDPACRGAWRSTLAWSHGRHGG
jgi:hypothetical protein